jgi:hypothetical protein
VGLDTLAAAIGEDAGTIEDVYEPYLVKTENAEASMKELEAQNKELLLNKARLEATLEESLLDGKKPVKKSAHASKGANESSDK